MDTNNNNNPLDPGLGSTPPTSDASSDAPVVAPDMGAPVSASPAPDPLAVPAVDVPVAPLSDVPAPVADMPPAAPASDAPVGFDPAIPAVETPVGDAQYNAELDAAKADFHTDMDNVEKNYALPVEPAKVIDDLHTVVDKLKESTAADASTDAETAVPTPATDAPTDGQS